MKPTVISILVASGLVVAAIFLSSGSPGAAGGESENANNVSIVNGKQVVAISAKGGYSPRISIAKAGIPTIIRVETRGIFDCSAALVVPAIGYRANLPPAGVTEIPVLAQGVGAEIRGLCAMGMYNFLVKFE